MGCCRTSVKLPEYAYYTPVYICDKCVNEPPKTMDTSNKEKLLNDI